MAYDKSYYDNKKKQIENKITKKVFDFYNQVKQILVAIDGDMAGLTQDLQELNMEMEMEQSKTKTEKTDEKQPKVEKKDNPSKL